MGDVTIITNGHRRELVSWHHLPEDAKSDFEYLTLDQFVDQRFVLYKGTWYDMFDTEGPILGWHAHISDTFFSGVLFNWPDATEPEVVVGRYYS